MPLQVIEFLLTNSTLCISVFIIFGIFIYLIFETNQGLDFRDLENDCKNISAENEIRSDYALELKSLIKNRIFSSDIRSIDFNKKCVINTINPHSYCVARKDWSFQKALTDSDILLPDGSGIVLASKILLRKKIKKIAGADIHAHLLKHANDNKKKVFYLGASQKTLDLITKRLNREFSEIQIFSYSPPYKTEFSEYDTQLMIDKVNKFEPDILFVGMTAPKQEKWVNANKHNLNATVIASVGAVFDFYAGTVKRSSKFWIDLGLEWLPRLLKEPKRLWKRNFISTPLFLLSIGKAKLNID